MQDTAKYAAAAALMQAVARTRSPVLITIEVQNLIGHLLDIARQASQEPYIPSATQLHLQACALDMLGSTPVSYLPVATQRTVGAVLQAWHAFPGNQGVVDLGLRSLTRGKRRRRDYLPLDSRYPDLACTASDVIEVLRLCPVRHLHQALVFLSFCPPEVLAMPGVVQQVQRFGLPALLAADALAYECIVHKLASKKKKQENRGPDPGNPDCVMSTPHPLLCDVHDFVQDRV
jgi:hypothetical protein